MEGNKNLPQENDGLRALTWPASRYSGKSVEPGDIPLCSDRFEKNWLLLQSLWLLAPSKFKELLGRHKTSHDLEPHVRSFCSTYDIDPHWCAELYSFATNLDKVIQCGHEKERDDEVSESMVGKRMSSEKSKQKKDVVRRFEAPNWHF